MAVCTDTFLALRGLCGALGWGGGGGAGGVTVELAVLPLLVAVPVSAWERLPRRRLPLLVLRVEEAPVAVAVAVADACVGGRPLAAAPTALVAAAWAEATAP